MTVYEFYQWCVKEEYQEYELYTNYENNICPMILPEISIDESQHRIIIE